MASKALSDDSSEEMLPQLPNNEAINNVKILSFAEILKKPETDQRDLVELHKKRVDPYDTNLSTFTAKMNKSWNIDLNKINTNLKDAFRESSFEEFGSIAGGLPENVVTKTEQDENAVRPVSPFTAMFNEGAKGDEVLAQTIVEVKAIYRDALRASGKCLKTY
jgi:hypothetical protein